MTITSSNNNIQNSNVQMFNNSNNIIQANNNNITMVNVVNDGLDRPSNSQSVSSSSHETIQNFSMNNLTMDVEHQENNPALDGFKTHER